MLTISINGNTVTGNAAEIAELLQLVETATNASVAEVRAQAPKPKAQPKPKAKREHADVLDTKRVGNMVKRATDTADKAGFEVKTMKQGAWVWLYPCGKSSGKGRSEEFKALKLAKGWVYSPKRGAWRRDFAEC